MNTRKYQICRGSGLGMTRRQALFAIREGVVKSTRPKATRLQALASMIGMPFWRILRKVPVYIAFIAMPFPAGRRHGTRCG